MNPTDRTAPASRTRTVFLQAVRGIGGLTALVSLLLIVGALTANTAAGESGQPAGVLGVIGLFLGGTLLAVGVLTRLVLGQADRR
ncbi:MULTISPECIES: hypothetical protein [unclassified Streptomyces]|uniref:hypothetical protein n=1 Tax=unclassified Streptomyces TaxID=2593676 RepID=UPI00166067CE|nr:MULTISPECIES: hypothetical protein [unclassified Streptomyces]MBD0709088.1 hypothetical protein [Streptomyces sp. CBMA291]MBD0716238.1 hypothetical protein [Streptomyces sp. CBMA370]